MTNRLLQAQRNGHANGKLRYSAQDWSGPSTGAHGGTYWTSRKTGEKVYQAQNPGANDATPQGKPDEPQKTGATDEALKVKAQKYVQQARDKWGDKAHENLTRIAANYANDQTPEAQRKLAAVKAMLGALGEQPAATPKPSESTAKAEPPQSPPSEGAKPTERKPIPSPPAAPDAPPEQPAAKAKTAAKPPRGMFHADPLAPAHDKLKALYDSALTDDRIYENTDAAMEQLGKTMGLKDLRELAAKFGIHDIGRTKNEILGNMGRKIKGRREFHDRMDVHLEPPLRHAADDYAVKEPLRYEVISLEDVRRMPGPEASAYARGILAMLQRQPALRREFKLEDLTYLEMVARDVDRYEAKETKPQLFSADDYDPAESN